MSSSSLNNQRYFVYVLIAIVLLFSGCGKRFSDTASTNEQYEKKIAQRRYRTQSFEKEAQGAYRGNTSFTAAVTGLYDSVDPRSAVDDGALLLANALFPRLTTIDPRTGAAKPSLAISWQLLNMDKGLTYVFTLREATWDDESPITAEHVRQSILRIMDPRHKNVYGAVLAHAIKGGTQLYSASENTSPSQLQALAQHVQSIVIDERTLHITVTSSGIPLLEMLAHPAAGVLYSPNFLDVSPSLLNLDVDTWMGGGAYTLSGKKDTMLIMTARKQFWVTPWAKKIIVVMGVEKESLQSGFERKQYDWVPYPFEPPDMTNEQANDIALQSTATEEVAPEDIMPTSQRLFEEYLGHLPKHVQHSYFSSLVLLDIPEQSRLRVTPTRTDLGVSANAELPASVSDIGYRLLETFVVKLLVLLFNRIKDTLQWRVAQHTFLPQMVLSGNAQEASLQLQVYAAQAQQAAHEEATAKNDVASMIQDNEPPIPINIEGPISFDTITRRVDYVTILQQNISRQEIPSRVQSSANANGSDKLFVLRIAFDHEVLQPIAHVIYDYFQSYGILAELVSIPAMEHPQGTAVRYDIALRLVTPIMDTPMAMLTTMWFDATKSSYAFNTSQNFDIRKMSEDFHAIGEGEAYDQVLYDWNKSLQDNVRYIPLWYVTHRERIDLKKFRWWSPTLARWHPLFPW